MGYWALGAAALGAWANNRQQQQANDAADRARNTPGYQVGSGERYDAGEAGSSGSRINVTGGNSNEEHWSGADWQQGGLRNLWDQLQQPRSGAGGGGGGGGRTGGPTPAGGGRGGTSTQELQRRLARAQKSGNARSVARIQQKLQRAGGGAGEGQPGGPVGSGPGGFTTGASAQTSLMNDIIERGRQPVQGQQEGMDFLTGTMGSDTAGNPMWAEMARRMGVGAGATPGSTGASQRGPTTDADLAKRYDDFMNNPQDTGGGWGPGGGYESRPNPFAGGPGGGPVPGGPGQGTVEQAHQGPFIGDESGQGLFGQQARAVFDPSRLDPANDPTMAPYLAAMRSSMQEDLDRQLQDVGDEFAGAGMYGGSGLALERGYTRQKGLEDINAAIGTTLFNSRESALNRQMQALGEVNQRDIAGGGYASDERQSAASRAAADRDAAANRAWQSVENASDRDLQARDQQARLGLDQRGQNLSALGDMGVNSRFGMQLGEDQRQFDDTFGEDQRQFDIGALGELGGATQDARFRAAGGLGAMNDLGWSGLDRAFGASGSVADREQAWRIAQMQDRTQNRGIGVQARGQASAADNARISQMLQMAGMFGGSTQGGMNFDAGMQDNEQWSENYSNDANGGYSGTAQPGWNQLPAYLGGGGPNGWSPGPGGMTTGPPPGGAGNGPGRGGFNSGMTDADIAKMLGWSTVR